jgi:hypothetical protein
MIAEYSTKELGGKDRCACWIALLVLNVVSLRSLNRFTRSRRCNRYVTERGKGFASKKTGATVKGRERQNLEERVLYQHSSKNQTQKNKHSRACFFNILPFSRLENT